MDFASHSANQDKSGKIKQQSVKQTYESHNQLLLKNLCENTMLQGPHRTFVEAQGRNTLEQR
jgi:hypothetical protein